jgi:hypothetical protein
MSSDPSTAVRCALAQIAGKLRRLATIASSAGSRLVFGAGCDLLQPDLVELVFNKIKQCPRIATHYDKLDPNT